MADTKIVGKKQMSSRTPGKVVHRAKRKKSKSATKTDVVRVKAPTSSSS
jgi:hypothetical protein